VGIPAPDPVALLQPPYKPCTLILMGLHDYIRFILSLGFVLALMVATAFALRRFGLARLGIAGGGKRLVVLETRLIDHRYKIVIVKCDEREHLLLLGPAGQSVIESNLPPVKSNGAPA